MNVQSTTPSTSSWRPLEKCMEKIAPKTLELVRSTQVLRNDVQVLANNLRTLEQLSQKITGNSLWEIVTKYFKTPKSAEQAQKERDDYNLQIDVMNQSISKFIEKHAVRLDSVWSLGRVLWPLLSTNDDPAQQIQTTLKTSRLILDKLSKSASNSLAYKYTNRQ